MPSFKEYNYRGFFSSEVRITGGKGYPIDLTARAGSPPSRLYQNVMTNLAEVIWYGAGGILIEPEYEAPWGAEVLSYIRPGRTRIGRILQCRTKSAGT